MFWKEKKKKIITIKVSHLKDISICQFAKYHLTGVYSVYQGVYRVTYNL